MCLQGSSPCTCPYDLSIRLSTDVAKVSHNLLGLCSHIFEMQVPIISNSYHLQSNSMSKIESVLGFLFKCLQRSYEVPSFIAE